MKFLMSIFLVSAVCVSGNTFSAESKNNNWDFELSLSLLSDNDDDSPVFFNAGAKRKFTPNWYGGFHLGTNFSPTDYDEIGTLTQLKFVAGVHAGRYVYSSQLIKTRLALQSGIAMISTHDSTPGLASSAEEAVIFLKPNITIEASKAYKNKLRPFLQVSYLQTITDPDNFDMINETIKTFKFTMGISY